MDTFEATSLPAVLAVIARKPSNAESIVTIALTITNSSWVVTGSQTEEEAVITSSTYEIEDQSRLKTLLEKLISHGQTFVTQVESEKQIYKLKWTISPKRNV